MRGKSVRQLMRMLVVWLVIGMMAIDSAMAGRLLARLRGQASGSWGSSNSYCADSTAMVYEPSSCASECVVVDSYCGSTCNGCSGPGMVMSDGVWSGVVVSDGGVYSSGCPVETAPSREGAAMEPTPAGGQPEPADRSPLYDDVGPMPAAGGDAAAAPSGGGVRQPATPAEGGTPTVPGTGAAAAPDATEAPSGGNDTETATETPTVPGDTGFDAAEDDLFGETESAAPLETDDSRTPPAAAEDAPAVPGNDAAEPRATDATDAVPADTATPAEDDLFGDAPAAADQPAAPGTDGAPAADAPAADTPADADDLFPEGAAVPADTGLLPTASENGRATDELPLEADELEQPKADDTGDELFDMPADEGNKDDSLEDLFSRVEQRLEQNSPQNDSVVLDVAAKRPVESAAPKPLAMRTWVDDTGTYTSRARLVEIGRTYIKLLKDNGRQSTVPMSRLSDEDFAYVHAIARRMGGTGHDPLVASK